MQLLPAKQEYALDDGTTGHCRLSLRVEPMARYFRKVTPFTLSSTVRPAPAFIEQEISGSLHPSLNSWACSKVSPRIGFSWRQASRRGCLE
jgi:hypothetical protein